MNKEGAQKQAEKFQSPLYIISILVILLGLLKLFGSVALCVIEIICGIILFLASSYKSFRLTVIFEIFLVLTMIQFLWIFGQLAQIHIETGKSPLFMDFYQGLFLIIIIATFVFDFIFVGFGYEAYKSFKYLEFSENEGTGPLMEDDQNIQQETESIKSNKNEQQLFQSSKFSSFKQ